MDPSQDDWFVNRFVPCQSRLYRFIGTLVPNRADAEELFQKTNLTAWQVRHTFDQGREIFPWLCGIARNHVRHYYRHRRTSPLRLDPDVVEQLAQLQMDEDATMRNRERALTRCLEKLPDRQRELVEQYYGNEQTIKSFAESRGQTPEAVYKALQRVRAALYQCINRTLAGVTH
jgi:RNA polymerase sigma-70 factor (ECF subfamily)